jgi:ABC-type bacteriocin/lantibiotic exporter with double-glycine peptidase domain
MNRTIIATIVLLVARLAYADFNQVTPGYFTASIEPKHFEFAAAPRVAGMQSQSNWCWAACIQMVLKYRGLFVEQENVFDRISGSWIHAQDEQQQILAALSRWGPDYKGSFSTVYASPYAFGGVHLVQDLAANSPLIADLRTPDGGDHAFVLTAISYRLGFFDQPIFDKVVLCDPWPEHEKCQELSWADFKQRLSFLVWVSVSSPKSKAERDREADDF